MELRANETMNQPLLEKVESLKNMLVSKATGGQPQERDYKQLRLELLNEPGVAQKLPQFVRTCRDLMEFWGVISKIEKYAPRREHIRQQFDPVLSLLESEVRAPSDTSSNAIIGQVNSANVHNAWRKALERRASDPEGAITAARTLLETVCKHILDEMNITYDDSMDLPKLHALVAKQLNLAPSQHSERVFKQILGGCHSVVEGLGALRNRLSDAHGIGRGAVRPAPRHAELAVNLAGTMATFLIATSEARKPRP